MRFMSFAGPVQKGSQNLFSQHGSARLPSFLLPSIYVQRTLPSESETLNKPQDEKQVLTPAGDSQKQILKSTGILGFSQVIIILIGMVRVKALAVLLGPVGVGVAGLYQNTVDLIRAATGLGLRGSAVRDIAASAATGDQQKISATVKVLRSWVWFTGLAGMAVTLIFCRPLSQWAFGSTDYAWGIAVLSVTILITSVSEGQNALLQGLRQIKAMAKAKVGAAFIGLIGAVAIYWIWGMKGIVPALIFVALTALGWNWYYARKIQTVPVAMKPKEIFAQGKSMAMLGFYLSITGIASTGMMYVVRAFVVQQGGLASVGHFVAAWSISFMYLSAIFGAMSGDYFPRLSAVQHDHRQMNRLVNEQTEIAMLLTAPIIITMITFIEMVVRIFYSKDFGPTAGILDWQLLGDFFKAMGWAMGFILLAKGKGRIFLFTELSWNVLYLGCVYFLWPHMGITATGLSFLIAYFLYAVILFLLSRKLTGFRFSRLTWQYTALFLPLLLAAFLCQRFLDKPYNLLAGGCVSLIAITFSFYRLKHILPVSKILNKIGMKKK